MLSRRSPFRRYPRPGAAPDMKRVLNTVHPEIGRALLRAADSLDRGGVPFALIGGLAALTYGVSTAPSMVEFLVGEEALQELPGGVVTLSPFVPVAVNDVPVDLVVTTGPETFLAESLTRTLVSDYMPIAPVEVLVYLGLTAGWGQELGNVAALLELTPNKEPIRKFLEENAIELLPEFVFLVGVDDNSQKPSVLPS